MNTLKAELEHTWYGTQGVSSCVDYMFVPTGLQRATSERPRPLAPRIAGYAAIGEGAEHDAHPYALEPRRHDEMPTERLSEGRISFSSGGVVA
eukprot:505335-Pyramimonas_sp.AAC.1